MIKKIKYIHYIYIAHLWFYTMNFRVLSPRLKVKDFGKTYKNFMKHYFEDYKI